MGIYKITNTINNKFYIGSAVNLYDRFLHHRKRLRGNYHNNQYLQRAFNKYGEDKFIFEIIETIDNKDNLLSLEQEWLDRTKCYTVTIGYNLAKNATAPMLGKKWSEEQREKFKKSRTGKKMPRDVVERLRQQRIGKKITDDHRYKLHEGNRKYWTDDNRKRKSEQMKDMYRDNPNLKKANIEHLKGREKTKEERKAISKRKQGSNHHNATLTENEVVEIKIMIRDGFKKKEIAEKFDVSINVIYRIANGTRWKHVII